MPARHNGSCRLWPTTRLCIYMRDQWRCQWCMRAGPDVVLTVDHLVPVAEGGGWSPDNLVTACWGCNCSRGATSVREYAGQVARQLGYTTDEIEGRVRRAVRRSTERHRDRARELHADPPRWLTDLRDRSNTCARQEHEIRKRYGGSLYSVPPEPAAEHAVDDDDFDWGTGMPRAAARW